MMRDILFKILLISMLALASSFNFAQEKVFYQNYEEAIEVARKIEAQYLKLSESGQEYIVNLSHIEGKFIDENIEAILYYLNNKGIPVSGFTITKELFEQQEQSFTSFIENKLTDKELSFLVQEKGVGSKQNYIRRNAQSLKKKISLFKNKLLGTPHGLSFWSFFVKNKKRVYDPNENELAMANEKKYKKLMLHSIGAATGFLAISQVIKENLWQPMLKGITQADFGLITAAGAPLLTWEMLLPIASVAVLVAPFSYYAREFSDFKNQGKTLLYSKKAGNAIKVIKNKLFYYTSSIAFSLLGNTLIMYALVKDQLTAGALGNAWLNSFIGTFAKLPVEFFIDNIDQKSKKAKAAGDIVLAEKLNDRVLKLRKYWVYLYSGIKNIHMLAPFLATALPQMETAIHAIWWGYNALGVMGLVRDVFTFRSIINNNVTKAIKASIYNGWHHCNRNFLSSKYIFKIKPKAN